MWKLYLLICLIFVPKNFEYYIGPFLLSPFRIFLIIAAPYILYALFTKRKFQWSTPDTLVVLFSAWPIIALSINTSLLKGIESGGVLFLELFFPYFLARQVVTSYQELKKFTHFFFILLVILVIPSIPETITGIHYMHNFFGAITGNDFYVRNEQRIGLWRAMSFLDSPITFGAACSVGFVLALNYFKKGFKYVFYAGVSTVGVIASVSSAPLLGLVSQFAFFSWAKVMRRFPYKWGVLLALILLAYVFVDIVSNRDPFRVAFSYLLFSEHNGYVRYYVWINSFLVVNQSFFSAIFGYGFATEQFDLVKNIFFSNLMKRSVDSYWLVNLVRYGWPMFLLLLFLVVSVIRKNLRESSKLKNENRRHKPLLEAWLIVVFSYTLISFTVHFWISMGSFYMVILALACTSVSRKKRTTVKS